AVPADARAVANQLVRRQSAQRRPADHGAAPDVEGADSFGYTRSRTRAADFYYNSFDETPTWRESNNGRPYRIVATGLYELPFGKGRAFAQSGLMNVLLGGFQVAGTWEYQPGPLISWPNLFFNGALADIAKGPQTLDQWFNTKAGFVTASAAK